MKTITHLSVALTLSACAAAALAHVSLQEPQAQAGGRYDGVLRVSHGCDGAGTTAITLRFPSGFENAQPQPKPGWNVSAQAGAITWTAAGKESVLPATQKGEFAFSGKAPRAPGPVWLKVLQTCEQGSMDWSEVPATGTGTAGMKTPAVLLEVMSARDFAQSRLLPKVEGAWVRMSVPGQQGTGAFMKLTAKEPMQLVGASTPVAGTADVHEMKLEGDVMRMRPVGKLDLPAGQTIELKPGGYHIMLQDLKQPLAKDTVVPLTLVLRNAKGEESKLELKLPVAVQPPGTATSAPMPPMADAHKH